MKSFPPVVDDQTRILILGSMPGEESLRQEQYYAHPQNQFWRILGAILDVPLEAMPYPTRLRALLREGIGLWDVYASCNRNGSSDGAIRDGEPNDVEGLLKRHPKVQRVICNGNTAFKLAQGLPVEVLLAPSTSPAYTIPVEQKLAEWMEKL